MNAVVATAPDRSRFLGGSDIAAVIGRSPWTTPVALYLKKTQPQVENSARKAFFARGHKWEAVVAEMLVAELESKGHRVEVVGKNKRYVDREFDFFACEIDFELRLDDDKEITNCELKTVHPFKAKEWGEAGTDEAPISYLAQCMFGLGITGGNTCLLAALFGADELKTYPIARDDQTIAALRERGRDFWINHVLAGVPPDPVEISDMSLLFPHEDEKRPALIADDDLTAMILRMRACDREIKSREAEFDALEFAVKRAMRDCGELVVNGKSAVKWEDRMFSHLDQDALKTRFPKIHKELMLKSSSRVFALKQFAWEK